MQTKPTYRIRNWSEYNRALIQRGSVTIWIDEKSIKNWFSSHHTCRAGRPATYSDEAILIVAEQRFFLVSLAA
jgi:Transposase DDE domain